MSPLILMLAQLASAGTVTMDGEVWKSLLAPEAPPAEKGPGPAVTWRDLRLQPRKEEVSFTATYTIRAESRGWFDGVLAGRGVEIKSAIWNGREAATTTGNDGTSITGWVEDRVELVVTGVVAGDASRGDVAFGLLDAPTGNVDVVTKRNPVLSATGAVAEVDGGFWTGARDLKLRVDPKEKPGPKPNLVIGQVGIGATILDSELVVKGHLRWGVVQGEIAQVTFTAAGAGPDLQVEGPQISDWKRSGDRVTVTLLEPERGAVDLDLRWTTALPDGDEASLPVPQILTEGTFRAERSLQIARDGGAEVVPQLQGWSPISSASLPDWGAGLVEGTPTAAYTASGGGAGQLSLFRFTPVSGPPTFVDVAAYNIAVTQEGRTLTRAHYQVRNERGALLRVVPPPNTRIVGARVAGKTAVVGADGDAWLIPLDKSVETVEGLLSFGVEVVLLGDGFDWENHEIREIPLPTVNAPVAVVRATLHLPPTYENKLKDGEGGMVSGFTEGEGITYGAAIGDVDAAQADAIFQEAVSAWMDNDFDAVQANLDALQRMDAGNENIDKLQANVDLISGKSAASGSGGAVALERRVKEQAKARSFKDKVAQEEVLKEAETAYLSGDYEKAEQQYGEALELGNKLVQLEQEESVDVSVDNSRLSSQLRNVADENSKRKSKADSTGEVLSKDFLAKLPAGRSYQSVVATEAPTQDAPPPPPIVFGGAEINFEDVVIDGKLIKPDVATITVGPASGEEQNAPGESDLDDYRAEPQALSESKPRGGRVRVPAFGSAKRVPKSSAPASPSPTASPESRTQGLVLDDAEVVFDPTPEPEPEPLEVRATTLSVVIPTQGEPVLYQHLLLEADAAFGLQIHAKKSRRDS